MSVFENILGNWIQIIDNENEITIENYGYATGVVEGTTDNHCIKCVAVNKCCFKNEKNKKPDRFDLTGIKILDMLTKGLFPGLYHPLCHCAEIPEYIDSVDKINLIVSPGKFEYLFNSKVG